MKRHIITFCTALFALSCLFTSCEGYLDVTPDGQSKRDDQLSTTDGIEDALYGCYASLRSSSLYGREMSFHTLDILAQYFTCYGNTTINQLLQYNYTNTSVKSLFESLWTDMYSNISNVNSILTSEKIEDATEYPYTIYRGEALALRAYMHFDLLRIFTEQITLNSAADGIPYATEFSLNTPDFVSASEVYEHILADLLEAEQLLADEAQYENESSFMTDRKIHLNRYAVKALLARVYLTMGDLTNAAKYAFDVIENGPCRLSTKTEVDGDLAGILSNNETLFGVYYADYYALVYPKLQQKISFSSLDPRDDIMSYYEDNVTGLDYRATAYFTATSSTSSSAYRVSKITDVYELNDNTSARPDSLILGINMIRLPEMYYIAAEALLDSDPDRATELFNEMLDHRGLEPLSNWPAAQQTLTVSAISAERYREFICEGQTWFNMKRLNLPITAAEGSTTFQPSNDIYVVPIPDIEYEYRY